MPSGWRDPPAKLNVCFGPKAVIATTTSLAKEPLTAIDHRTLAVRCTFGAQWRTLIEMHYWRIATMRFT